jgi:heavy metal efflux system protein
MVNGIITFSLRNPAIVFLFTAITVIAGIYAYRELPIEAFPDVTNTRVRIITQWDGRSAEELEKFVTIPVETEMNTVPDVVSLRSVSLFGLSVVTLIFEDHVDDFTAQQHAIARLINLEFPEGAEYELEPPSGATGEIFRYVLMSDDMHIRDITALQEWVVERNLRSVNGVADVVSFGGEEKIYEISVNPDLLVQYNLTALDVFERVSSSNINVGGDVIEKSGQAYVVRGLGLLSSIEDIENILITNKDGTPILVSHVAEVREWAMPRQGQVGLNEHDDLVQGIVVMRRGENPSDVIERIRAKVDELNERILPDNVEIIPFYDRNDLVDTTVRTVTFNLLEGIVLVTVIVLLFMAEWRTTVMVAIIIPLSLLFAFICLRLMGMSANLISMGAIDFGIIIDGAVVMVEGIFVALDRKRRELGLGRFNRLAKLSIIKKSALEMGNSVFFGKVIIITALLPIFAFQQVEGKMFSPLAWTLGFALFGALIFSLTLVPAMARYMLYKNVEERETRFIRFIRDNTYAAFEWVFNRKALSLATTGVLLVGSLFIFRGMGTEFLPHINEGAIYVRATLPNSVSLNESLEITHRMKDNMLTYPEVDFVLTQTGRPNDGTDPTGFFNIEFHVELHPEREWTSGRSQSDVLRQMQEDLDLYPGIELGFSQPIMDNVEEYVSGVKSSLVAKLFGDDLFELERYAEEIADQLHEIQGIEDIAVFRNIGQPELQILLDQRLMALYGVTTEDAQAIIEMAIGGRTANEFFDDERRFDIRVRYKEDFRRSQEEIGNILVPAAVGGMVRLSEIADIQEVTGPSFVYREQNQRHIAVGFSVRGRDLGGAVAEAQGRVAEHVDISRGYTLEWAGEFENQERALARLQQIIPVTLILIFFLLFIAFGSVKDAMIALCTIPFALIGGILSLWVTGTFFGISAGVGIIILFGVCVLNGVILISDFNKRKQGSRMSLELAIKMGVKDRIRPVIMTALLASFGLVPAAISTGIGSEIQKPLAIVIVGGMIIAMILTLLILPVIYYLAYKKNPSPEKEI